MSTSGSYSWTLNRDQTILLALQFINVLGETDTTVPAAKLVMMVVLLNGMLKLWSIDGIKTPKRRVGYIFTQNAQSQYVLGSVSGSDNCTNSYESTTITTPCVLGQTAIPLTSTTGMNANDNIGIELDNNTRQWTTIISIDSSTQVTITTGLTTTAAAMNTVVAYTNKLNKPLKVLYGTRKNLDTGYETEVSVIGHDQYYKLPTKAVGGAPNNFYYDKQISGARPNNSTAFIYPVPQDVKNVLCMVYTDGIQDMINPTDELDLPAEWLLPVAICLGVEAAYFYGKFIELEKLQPKATALYELIKNASYDDEPVTFKIKSHK